MSLDKIVVATESFILVNLSVIYLVWMVLQRKALVSFPDFFRGKATIIFNVEKLVWVERFLRFTLNLLDYVISLEDPVAKISHQAKHEHKPERS